MEIRDAKLTNKTLKQEQEDIEFNHNAQIQSLEQTNEELETKFKEFERDNDSLKDRIHTLQMEIADNNGTTTELIEKNSQIAELNNKVFDLESKLMDQKEMTDKLEEAENKILSLEKMVDAKSLLVEKLRENAKESEEMIREEMEEERDSKIFSIQTKYEEKIEELEKKLAEKEKGKLTLFDVTDLLDDLAMDLGDDELAELTLENQNLIQKIKLLEDHQEDHKDKTESLQNEVHELQQNAENCITNIGEKTKLIQALRVDVQDLEDQNETLKRKFFKAEEQLKQSSNTNGVSSNAYKELQSEFIKSKQ